MNAFSRELLVDLKAIRKTYVKVRGHDNALLSFGNERCRDRRRCFSQNFLVFRDEPRSLRHEFIPKFKREPLRELPRRKRCTDTTAPVIIFTTVRLSRSYVSRYTFVLGDNISTDSSEPTECRPCSSSTFNECTGTTATIESYQADEVYLLLERALSEETIRPLP